MFSKKILAISIAALCFSTSALAAEKENEISLAGSLSSTQTTPPTGPSLTTSSANIFVSFGHYFDPQLVGQIAMGVIGSDSGGGSSSAVLVLGVGGKYYFQASHSGDIVPFIGGRLDLLSVSQTSANTTTTGGGAQVTGFLGISDFVSETASLDLTFSLSSGSFTMAGASMTQVGTSLDVGFTQRF